MAGEPNTVDTSYGEIEIPGGEAQIPEGAAPQAPAPEVPWYEQHANSELEFTAAGKAVKAPLSKVKQWAQQGYDYAQRMQLFNQQKAELDQRHGEFQKDAEWGEIAKYARENPEWAQFARQQWDARENWRSQNADNPLLSEFQALKREIDPLKQEALTFRKERERIQTEAEDKALEADIKMIGEKYSKLGIDLSSFDETGMSLEDRVVDYAKRNGIKTFPDAFHAMYGPKLVAMQEEALKKQWTTEQAKLKKEGFIGRTPTPTQTAAPAKNVRNRSYSSLAEEALGDLAAGKY